MTNLQNIGAKSCTFPLDKCSVVAVNNIFFRNYSSTLCLYLVPGGYSYILAIWLCAAGKGMVFKPFSLVYGLVIEELGAKWPK